MEACLRVWDDKGRWTAMMRAGMSRDFSWMTSAVQYDALFRRLLNL
jgi:glycogen synthase